MRTEAVRLLDRERVEGALRAEVVPWALRLAPQEQLAARRRARELRKELERRATALGADADRAALWARHEAAELERLRLEGPWRVEATTAATAAHREVELPAVEPPRSTRLLSVVFGTGVVLLALAGALSLRVLIRDAPAG